jgi:hypothetical protein
MLILKSVKHEGLSVLDKARKKQQQQKEQQNINNKNSIKTATTATRETIQPEAATTITEKEEKHNSNNSSSRDNSNSTNNNNKCQNLPSLWPGKLVCRISPKQFQQSTIFPTHRKGPSVTTRTVRIKFPKFFVMQLPQFLLHSYIIL